MKGIDVNPEGLLDVYEKKKLKMFSRKSKIEQEFAAKKAKGMLNKYG